MSGERAATGPGQESIAFPTSKGPAAPRAIGRYEILEVLGQGGMASVYLGRARGPAGFQKLLAIKKVHDHLASDRQFAAMFLDEARIAAALHHPNVAQVFELGEENGAYFLAMEYLLGEHLGTVLRKLARAEEPVAGDARTLEVLARIVALAAEGLHHAHEAHDELGQPLRIVHRDVSPQNVFVTYAGHVKLTDFGIAKATSNEVRTDTGTVKGKFAYMSPEQALGRTIDRRTDVFALGAVLWECVTSRRLFRSATDAETLLKVTRCEVPVPSSVAPHVPRELDRIVMRCLAPTPEARYATAGELAHDLEAFLAPREQQAHAMAIGGLMTGLFGAEIAARQAAVRRALARDASADPAGEVGPPRADGAQPAIPSLEADATVSHSQSRPRASVTPEPVTPPVPLVPLESDVSPAEPEATAAVELVPRRARASIVESEPLPVEAPLAPSRAVLLGGLAALAGVVAVGLGALVLTGRTAGPEVAPTAPAGSFALARAEDAGPSADAARSVDAAVVEVAEPSLAAAPLVADAGSDGGRRRPALGPRTVPAVPAGQPIVVEISCIPSAEVFVGSHSHGMTPAIVEIPAGTRVRLLGERGERIVRPVPGPDGTAQIGGASCP